MSECGLQLFRGAPECIAPVDRQGLEQFELKAGILACRNCAPQLFADVEQELAQTQDKLTETEIERDQYRLEAYTHPVTNTPNRRYMSERILDLARSGRLLGLLVVDLEKFKLVNDLEGHIAGDQILRYAAKDLQGERPDEVVANIGGDEMVALVDQERLLNQSNITFGTLNESEKLRARRFELNKTALFYKHRFNNRPQVQNFNKKHGLDHLPAGQKLGMKIGGALISPDSHLDALIQAGWPKAYPINSVTDYLQ